VGQLRVECETTSTLDAKLDGGLEATAERCGPGTVLEVLLSNIHFFKDLG
jgi:hypothetical protein